MKVGSFAVSNMDALLALAADAARAAGAELRRRQGRVSGLEAKSSATDPVSDADRAAERLLVERILSARPDDGLVGEEGAERVGDSGIRWVVDPLDGTVNYLYGLPVWSVSVAAEDGHGALIGVVYDPTRDELFSAARGRGARLGDDRIRVHDPVALERALVGTGFAYEPDLRRWQGEVVAALLPRVRDIRRPGSAALDLSWLACGRVDGFYEHVMSRWDWAAGALIATEAGAQVAPLPGPGGRAGVIAAGPALFAPLQAAVSGPGAGAPRPRPA